MASEPPFWQRALHFVFGAVFFGLIGGWICDGVVEGPALVKAAGACALLGGIAAALFGERLWDAWSSLYHSWR